MTKEQNEGKDRHLHRVGVAVIAWSSHAEYSYTAKVGRQTDASAVACRSVERRRRGAKQQEEEGEMSHGLRVQVGLGSTMLAPRVKTPDSRREERDRRSVQIPKIWIQ